MPDEMNWKDKLRNELDKVRAMDRAQRISYYKTYYMIPSIVALLVLLCIFSYIFEVIHNRTHKALLSGVFVNTDISEEGALLLKNDFPAALPKELNPNGKGTIAIADEYIQIHDLDFENVQENNQKIMALVAQVAVGEIDFMVLDEETLEGFAQSDIYTDGVEILNLNEEGRSERLGITPEESYLVFTYHDWEDEKVQLARELLKFIKEIQKEQ